MGARHEPGANRWAVLAALACLLGAHAATADDLLATGLGEAMAGWLATLDAEQRSEALYAFDDDERFDLRLAPFGLEGLRVDRMSEAQWRGLEAALGGVLSADGLEKMNTIRSLEREVAELEGGFRSWLMGRLRDPRRYFLALFGDPASGEAWGLRFDGHHLSLNWTALPGEPLSVTPLFLGGQPREVPEPLERAGLRVLAAEEDLAVALIEGLPEAGRGRARLAFEEGGLVSRPMMVGADPELEPVSPAGLSWAELEPASRAALERLIDVYLANFAAPIAERHRRAIRAETPSLHFAYAVGPDRPGGVARPGDPLYYRIQGASFLIEFDDTPEEADHVHVVWRQLQGDFGRDLLAEHYEEHHAH